MFTTSYQDCGHGINFYEQTYTRLNAFQLLRDQFLMLVIVMMTKQKSLKLNININIFVIITKSPDKTVIVVLVVIMRKKYLHSILKTTDLEFD